MKLPIFFASDFGKLAVFMLLYCSLIAALSVSLVALVLSFFARTKRAARICAVTTIIILSLQLVTVVLNFPTGDDDRLGLLWLLLPVLPTALSILFTRRAKASH